MGANRCPLIEVGRSYHSFGAWILSHGIFTSFALCLYQFLKVLLMSLEESKIVWRLCLTGFYNAGIALTAIRSESTFS